MKKFQNDINDIEEKSQKADVFFSYSRKDQTYVKRINAALKGKGFVTSMDTEDILPAEEWEPRIDNLILQSDNFLFIISPESISSVQCNRELELAVKLNKFIIPILYRKAQDKVITGPLSSKNQIQLKEEDNWETGIKEITAALNLDHHWTRLHSRFLEQAQEWYDNDKRSSYLLRGKILKKARNWLAEAPSKKTEPKLLQRQFIAKSHNAAIRRKLILAAVVFTILGLSTWGRIAQLESSSRRLANQALAEMENNPTRSLTLALEALEVKRTDLAVQALRQAFLKPRPENVITLADTALSAAFDQEGRYLIVAPSGQIWDLDQRIEVAQLNEFKSSEVAGLGFKTDLDWVFSVNPHGDIRIWEKTSGRLACRIPYGQKPLCDESLTKPAEWILKYKKGGVIRIWNRTADGYPVSIQNQHAAAGDSARSPNWTATASGGDDFGLTLRKNVQSAITVGHPKMPGIATIVLSVAFSPDSQFIVSSGEDYTARVWNIQTKRQVALLKGHGAAIYRAAFSPEGRFVITAGLDSSAKVWDWKHNSNQPLTTLKYHTAGLYSAVFSPTGHRIATTAGDKRICIWNTANWKEQTLNVEKYGVDSAFFSESGKYVITTSYNTGRLWERNQGKLLAEFKWPNLNKSKTVEAVPEKNLIFAIDPDGSAIFWDTKKSRILETVSLAQLKAGRELNFAGQIWQCNLTENDRYRVLDENKTEVISIKKSPVERNGCKTYHAKVNYDSIEIYNSKNSKLMSVLKDHTQRIQSVAFSRDCNFLISASQDNTARIWDPVSGQSILTLGSHKSWVQTAAFSPDASAVVTASFDKTVKIFSCPVCMSLDELIWQSQKYLQQDH